MSTKTKTIIFALILLIIIGVVGVVVWQFYGQKEVVAGPITVVDDVGRNVTITKYPPERIVSLAPSCTEILYALGLGNRIVGVDEYSDYPPEVVERVKTGNLTTVGSFAEISIESVMGLQPDLILATGGVQRTIVETLEGLGQTVVVLYPKRFGGVLADISLVGKITGQVNEAEKIVADMRKIAQEIADKTKNASRPRVYVECFFNGGYWSFASDSYVDELIYMAGGINIFAGFPGGHFSTSTEEVVKADPQIIIISRGVMSDACGLKPETIRTRPGWSEISAVQNSKIYEVEESIMVLGTPRLIKGLQELAKVIHPELFS